MKISNETKIGALTAIAITVLILGFNYLKGKNITDRSDEVYAVFSSVKGVAPSNPVKINGLQVGKVLRLQELDKNVSGIVVTIALTKDINIPSNSVALISSDLLGTTALEIEKGTATTYLKSGDTMQSMQVPGIIGEVKSALAPAMDNINKTLASLDQVLKKIDAIVDPNTQNNIQSIIANLMVSSKSLQQLLNTQTGALAKTLGNFERLSDGLAHNTGKIDSTLSNLELTTRNLSKAKIDEAINSLQGTLTRLDNVVSRMNSKDGTLGLLLNDRQLYDELHQTSRSLTILLDDFRVNPKRYVNISVFGKKDKKGPLKTPLYDSTSKIR
jgi:phospholipid/cholesterol/gamma-HCH transport system substrate-binding protein